MLETVNALDDIGRTGNSLDIRTAGPAMSGFGQNPHKHESLGGFIQYIWRYVVDLTFRKLNTAGERILHDAFKLSKSKKGLKQPGGMENRARFVLVPVKTDIVVVDNLQCVWEGRHSGSSLSEGYVRPG